jgi:hypothetical protein
MPTIIDMVDYIIALKQQVQQLQLQLDTLKKGDKNKV